MNFLLIKKWHVLNLLSIHGVQIHDVHSEPGFPLAQAYSINTHEYLIVIDPLIETFLESVTNIIPILPITGPSMEDKVTSLRSQSN